MHLRIFLCGLFLLPALAVARDAGKYAQNNGARGLRDVTVLIIRHAEKPFSEIGLSDQGEQRAAAYASYFDPLRLGKETLQPQRLIATSDSESSERPRLTLMPLAARLQLPLEQPFADKEYGKLVDSLRQTNQAGVVLIAWHHGHIDDLIDAFGGDSQKLLGHTIWPENVYNWVVVLRFDQSGQLIPLRSRRVQEHLLPGD
jgi:hypothetical protein